MQQFTGIICVILAGIGFGFLGIFGRLAFDSGVTVGELLTFRFTLASLMLFLGLLVYKKSLIRLNLKQILISAALGSGGYAVFSTLYFKSIQGLSVSLAALLLFTFPIFVNLGSHFILKQRMTQKQFFSLILACLGISILLWGPVFFDSMVFIIYALAAAVAYSIYVLVSGQTQQNVHPLSSSLYVITAAAITLALFHQPDFSRLMQFTSQQMFYIFGLSIICTILPLTLFLIGLQHLPSSQASILVMIEPVVAALAAWLVLGEKLKPLQYFGMALVFVALILNAHKNQK